LHHIGSELIVCGFGMMLKGERHVLLLDEIAEIFEPLFFRINALCGFTVFDGLEPDSLAPIFS
jgi:hypothetical protein